MRHWTMVGLAVLASCGGAGTAQGTEILNANVAAMDVPADVRRTLVGMISHDQSVAFPDGEGRVTVHVTHGRAADTSQGDVRVPGADATLYLRIISIEVDDAAG